MKRAVGLLLLLSLCLLLAVPALADGPKVQVSAQSLVADGKSIKCEKYNIDGSNYFKLRDIAMLMKDTPAAFGISFDTANKRVFAQRGGVYEPLGTELKAGDDNSASCVVSVWTLFVDGKKVEVSTYNIGGSNFYKLRDMGDVLGFIVDYDQTTNTSYIYSDLLRTATTSLKVPFGESAGWNLSAPAEQQPADVFYCESGEMLGGKVTASAPIITRRAEEGGRVTYTIRFTETGSFRFQNVTTPDSFFLLIATYLPYDYYTGALFLSRGMTGNDSLSDRMLISYHGKAYPVSYKLVFRDEGGAYVDGTNINYTINYTFIFNITVPLDYNGLVMAMKCGETQFRNEAYRSSSSDTSPQAQYWNNANDGYVFIRVSDWAVDDD